ncbi:ATP-binding protein [Corallincola holothuriorum]|uniref:ATP-binding protein n=1 Tax=Corallincola holothuriorum TaxID=2282215 RepID=A0A368NIT0_9GAMM|nr:ATP-binding protein [Corallincola holothuriorum]RCU49564.1 ATP-binding protein [Corallincola holothuriorum]
MSALNRIILINTHLPGVVELALDGHTNICGTNASGKTTLQRLVPVFYGEYPSRVVPSTRDSFEKWYLPREDSYIVYEYQRMDGEFCQAVMAAASDRNGVRYRLLGKGFDLEDYLKQRDGETLTFLTMEEFGRVMKSKGLAVTRQLNTREFRGIIQNDRVALSSGSSKAELRTLARQFSLCDSEHTLRHIEKLARAVHSKEGKMETIKSMIAAILEEDGVTPPASSLNPQKVEGWIRESQLIQGFAAIRPEFERLEQQYNELLSCELRLAGLKRGYQADESLQLTRQSDAKAEIELLGNEHKQLESGWKDQRDTLNQQLSVVKGELESFDSELQNIEDQYQSYQDKDIEQARANLERMTAWRDDLANLEARFRLLTEAHQDIESAYNERRSKIDRQLNRVLSELNEQKDTLQEERDNKREQQHDDLAAQEKLFSERRQSGLARFKEREYELKLAKAEQQAKLDGVTYIDEEKQALMIFDERILLADESREAVEEKQERLHKEEKIAKRQQETADEALRQTTRRLNECESQARALNELLYPGHHSLLEFLRKEHPQWEGTLGKVIHPELLQRSDLKPSLTADGAEALYRVWLDLSALETPEYARSEQELKLQLAQAEERQVETRNQQEQAEQALVQASQVLDDVRRELVFAGTELKNARADVKRLQEEKRNEQTRIDAALAERKLAARQQLEQIAHQLGQLVNEQAEWLELQKSLERDASMEKRAYWDEVVGAIDSQLQQLRDEMAERQAKAKQELKACSDWYKRELKSRGVDDSEIGKLKREIEALERQIQDTERMRDEVANYLVWYKVQWTQRKPKLQSQFSELQNQQAELQQQLAAANSQFKQQRQTLESQLQQAKAIRLESEELLEKLKTLLRRLNELQLPRDAVEVAGSLNERLNLGESLLHSREQLLTAVKDGVDRFDREIANQYGSSLAETWERSREECMLIGESGVRSLDYRKLVPELARLINELVPQKITAVKQLGRTYGRDLNNYYDVLHSIDNRIASQSARITREVDEELFLDGVSESAVKIRSRVAELEFWPQLQEFVQAYKNWQAEDFNTLPSEEYTSSMRRALEIIGRSALSGGVASLLGIELRLREGNSDLVIRTDRQLNESSSHGMAYLILCKFLLAFTRLLRGRSQTVIHWPIDELGTLAHNNIKKIFDACGNNQIRVLGAFPNPDAEVLSLFSNRYIINKQSRQLQVVKPKIDPIAEKLNQKAAQMQQEVV